MNQESQEIYENADSWRFWSLHWAEKYAIFSQCSHTNMHWPFFFFFLNCTSVYWLATPRWNSHWWSVRNSAGLRPFSVPHIIPSQDVLQFAGLNVKWECRTPCSNVTENFKMVTAQHSNEWGPFWKWGPVQLTAQSNAQEGGLVFSCSVLGFGRLRWQENRRREAWESWKKKKIDTTA